MAAFAWIAIMTALTLNLTTPDPDAGDADQPTATGFLYKTVTVEGEQYAYCLYVPPDYTPEKAWPAVLFLHGSGERGSDGFLQTDVGIGHILRRKAGLIPAVVIMPQCRPNQGWVGPMGRMALRCLEESSREYHIDARRLYLTGLSLGGQGTWFLAANLPGRFAAIVPVCGFADLGEQPGLVTSLAQHLKGVPIWCFHGALDDRVPVSKAQEMVSAIRGVGGTIFYTEYPDGKHVIWDRAYGDRKLWKWLLEQRLSAPETVAQPTRQESDNKPTNAGKRRKSGAPPKEPSE